MRKLLIIVSLFTMMSCQENFDMIDSESLPETSSTNPEFKVNEEDIQSTIDEFYGVSSLSPTRVENFVSIKKITSLTKSKTRSIGNDSDIDVNDILYIVELSNGNTAFVAADKRAKSLYGIADGTVELNNADLINSNIPGGLVAILSNAIADIKYSIKYNTSINEDWKTLNALTRADSDIVGGKEMFTMEPRCPVCWHQFAPFNNVCPLYTNSNGDKVRSAAGCVAVAAAQALLCLWDRSKTTFYYYTLITSWDRLSEIKHDNQFIAGSDEETDVANLIHEIGLAVGMKYGPSSSANTEDAVKAVCLLSQGYLKYERSPFNETIENTLVQKNGIVWLSARNSNDEGHSMLIDALRFIFTTGACGTCIDATKYVKRYFHINYGWGESYNGYYLYIPQSDNYDQGLRWEGTSRTFPYQMKAFSVWQTKNE